MGNVTQALEYVDPKCGGSVHHGIIMSHFMVEHGKLHYYIMTNIPYDGDIDINEIGPEQENPYSMKRWECLYGVGHGLAVLYDYAIYCYFGMGRLIFYAYLDPSKMEESIILCELGNPIHQNGCIRGIARTMVDQSGIQEAFHFCSLNPGKFKADCYNIIGQWLYTEHSSGKDRHEICSGAESAEYARICLDADISAIDLL